MHEIPNNNCFHPQINQTLALTLSSIPHEEINGECESGLVNDNLWKPEWLYENDECVEIFVGDGDVQDESCYRYPVCRSLLPVKKVRTCMKNNFQCCVMQLSQKQYHFDNIIHYQTNKSFHPLFTFKKQKSQHWCHFHFGANEKQRCLENDLHEKTIFNVV